MTVEAIGSAKWIKILSNKRVVLASGVLAGLLLLALFGPLLSPYRYFHMDVRSQFSPPTLEHPMGTDSKGRDLWVRVFTGTRISFLVAAFATAVSVFIGVVYGGISGFWGGKVDGAMMRIVDVFYSVPYLFLVVLLTVIWGRGLFVIVFALGAFQWLTMARIVRGQVLSLKRKEFVEAARALGDSPFSILFRHIIPNLTGLIVVYLTLTIPRVMLQEAFLSFLGLGIPPPMASLGTLAAEGYSAINPLKIYWWLVLFPGGVLTLSLFSLNFLGEELAQIFHPVKERVRAVRFLMKDPLNAHPK